LSSIGPLGVFGLKINTALVPFHSSAKRGGLQKHRRPDERQERPGSAEAWRPAGRLVVCNDEGFRRIRTGTCGKDCEGGAEKPAMACKKAETLWRQDIAYP
jgi:hypothetical protein